MPVRVERSEAIRIGSQVRHFRKERNLTQEQLGKRSGISKQTISNIENGSNVPGLLTALNIARALGVSVEELAS